MSGPTSRASSSEPVPDDSHNGDVSAGGATSAARSRDSVYGHFMNFNEIHEVQDEGALAACFPPTTSDSAGPSSAQEVMVADAPSPPFKTLVTFMMYLAHVMTGMFVETVALSTVITACKSFKTVWEQNTGNPMDREVVHQVSHYILPELDVRHETRTPGYVSIAQLRSIVAAFFHLDFASVGIQQRLNPAFWVTMTMESQVRISSTLRPDTSTDHMIGMTWGVFTIRSDKSAIGSDIHEVTIRFDTVNGKTETVILRAPAKAGSDPRLYLFALGKSCWRGAGRLHGPRTVYYRPMPAP